MYLSDCIRLCSWKNIIHNLQKILYAKNCQQSYRKYKWNHLYNAMHVTQHIQQYWTFHINVIYVVEGTPVKYECDAAESKSYFCRIENFAYREINEWSLSNPQTWTFHINVLHATTVLNLVIRYGGSNKFLHKFFVIWYLKRCSMISNM